MNSYSTLEMGIGGVVRRRRLELGLTRDDLDRCAKTPPGTVARVENQDDLISFEQLSRIGQSLGLSLSSMFHSRTC